MGTHLRTSFSLRVMCRSLLLALVALRGVDGLMGFSVCYLQEAITGKGVLQQYGLPYDEGVVLSQEGFEGPVFAVLGLVFAIALVVGLSYGGEFAYSTFVDKDYKGATLPGNPLL